MLSEFTKRKLRFVVMPTRFPLSDCEQDLERAYQCWRSVWGQALSEEMNVKEELYSDHFSRKSHVAVVFYGDDPLGLCTSNILDLRLKQDLDDSYFKVWPPVNLEELKSFADRITTCCNATLNFKYRKNHLGFSGIELLFALHVLYLKSTNLDAIVGTPRLERGVEKVCYRTGAISMATNLPYTNIPGQFIDLVCWKRDLDLNQWDPEIRDLAEYIWSRSTQIIFDKDQGERYAA